MLGIFPDEVKGLVLNLLVESRLCLCTALQLLTCISFQPISERRGRVMADRTRGGFIRLSARRTRWFLQAGNWQLGDHLPLLILLLW